MAVAPACDTPARVRETLTLLTASGGQMRVSDVAAMIGVHERTLRRDITAAVGLSPKVLARILRFQRAIALLQSKQRSNLCTIALDSGYADQAHMDENFKRFQDFPQPPLFNDAVRSYLFWVAVCAIVRFVQDCPNQCRRKWVLSD